MASPDRTHYEVLGIARDADADEVRRAWRMLVQVWHPDRFSGEMHEHAEAQAARINEAYHALRDGGRRAAYDCRLAADEAAAERAAAPRRTNIPTWPQSHQPASAPIRASGTRVATETVPVSGIDGVWRDISQAVRRHPRITAAAAVAWVVVCGGTFALHTLTGPSLPAVPTTAAVSHSTISASSQDEQLAELAEQARKESAAAEAEFQDMLEQDVAAEAAAAKPVPTDPRAGGGAAPDAPAAGRDTAPNMQEIRKPDGTRVLRVLPG